MSKIIESLRRLQLAFDDGRITNTSFEHQKTQLLRSDVLPKIGGYQLLEKIGEGGMGTVYLGINPQIETLGFVAIKILHAHYANQSEYRERFIAEAQIGLKLTHPNITRVHHLLNDGSSLGLVMEYVEGVSLSEMIGSIVGPIPWLRTKVIIDNILDAIIYAHAQGVVHRDIKPENIIVYDDSQIKIMDFGIAKQTSNNKTKTGVSMGTINYMAPEQFLSFKTIDDRADIYALGITLYEMLAGRLPWDPNRTDYEIMNLKDNDAIPSPTDFYPYIPSHVVDCIKLAIKKDPSRRIQSVVEFRERLSNPSYAKTSHRPHEKSSSDESPVSEFSNRPKVTNNFLSVILVVAVLLSLPIGLRLLGVGNYDPIKGMTEPSKDDVTSTKKNEESTSYGFNNKERQWLTETLAEADCPMYEPREKFIQLPSHCIKSQIKNHCQIEYIDDTSKICRERLDDEASTLFQQNYDKRTYILPISGEDIKWITQQWKKKCRPMTTRTDCLKSKIIKRCTARSFSKGKFRSTCITEHSKVVEQLNASYEFNDNERQWLTETLAEADCPMYEPREKFIQLPSHCIKSQIKDHCQIEYIDDTSKICRERLDDEASTLFQQNYDKRTYILPISGEDIKWITQQWEKECRPMTTRTDCLQSEITKRCAVRSFSKGEFRSTCTTEHSRAVEELNEKNRSSVNWKTYHRNQFTSSQRKLFTTSRRSMINNYIASIDDVDTAVVDAMSMVPMEIFSPYGKGLYQNAPVYIGYSETISQPSLTALMLTLLEISPNDKVLEIKTASGYQTTIMAQMGASVYTVETDTELGNRLKAIFNSISKNSIYLKIGGYGYNGWSKFAPYDAIIVTAAYRKVPQSLLDQLNIGGKMIAPIGDLSYQKLMLYTKREDGSIYSRNVMSVRFSFMPEEK